MIKNDSNKSKTIIKKKDGTVSETTQIHPISPDLPLQKIFYIINKEVDELTKKASGFYGTDGLQSNDIRDLKEYAGILLNAKKVENEETKILLQEEKKN